MAVHTYGNTAAPTYGSDSSSAYNEIVNHIGGTMPATGYISKLHAYFGVSGGTSNAKLLLFNGSYVLKATSAAFYVGSTGWQSAAITPILWGSGGAVVVGWFVPSGLLSAWGVYSSGSWAGGSVSSPSNASGFSVPGSPYFQGGLGWYVEYLDPLTVSSVSPGVAGIGQSVTVSGVGFTGGSITGVTLGGVACSHSVINDTTMSVTVPSGVAGGPQTLAVTSDHGNDSTTLTVSSAYVVRAGVETSAQGIYVVRSGTPSMAQGILRWRNGAWVNAQ